MRLFIEIFGEALRKLYDGLGEETVTIDNNLALTRAAVVRSSRQIAHNFVNDFIHENARDQIEAQLQRRLEEFSSTFSETIRAERQNEIHDQFVQEYAGPVHVYLESRMAEFAATVQNQIVAMHSFLDEGILQEETGWTFNEAMVLVAVMITLFYTIFYGFLLMPFEMSPQMALTIDVGILTIFLMAVGLTGNRNMTVRLDRRIEALAQDSLLQNQKKRYLDQHRTRFPNNQDISQEAEQKTMTDRVDLSQNLLAISPPEFLNAVFRNNRLSQLFGQEGRLPRMPDEIAFMIFRYMLPRHVFAAMVQLIPGATLSLILPENQSGTADSNDDAKKGDDSDKKTSSKSGGSQE